MVLAVYLLLSVAYFFTAHEHYLIAKFGNAGGLCPLIDKDGKPIITE